MVTTRSYEPNRDLIISVENSWNTTNTISQYTYSNDDLGRRTYRSQTGSAFATPDIINYGYNTRSELTGAQSFTNALYDYLYDYDPIGNRKWTQMNANTNVYDSNELNQYTNIVEGVTPLMPQYDADGNMTAYNGWTYQWNGENRLILASNGTIVVENQYDYMGRRIHKTVSDLGSPTSDLRYLYDGWNMIKESSNTETNFYVWGLDLSQSLQGAGGVAGLLSVINADASEVHFAAYDANGNVSEYIDGGSGTVEAHYEYAPFGNITESSGAMVADFAYRFSTKYLDDVPQLYYYGFRFYKPDWGRFINRDPLEESGGVHLINFVEGDPVGDWDYLGLVRGRFIYTPPYFGNAGPRALATSPASLNENSCVCKKRWFSCKYYLRCRLTVEASVIVNRPSHRNWGGNYSRLIGGVLAHEQRHINAYRNWYAASKSWMSAYEIDYDDEQDCQDASNHVTSTVARRWAAMYAHEIAHTGPNWP